METKVLIMVLSNSKTPYLEMYKAQRDTWDSVKHDNIDTVYYWGDKYELLHVPFLHCLKSIWHKDWDIIFRTNSSSYVDKPMFWEFIKDKPKEGLYIGNMDGEMSGAGFFISRDLAKLLMDELTEDEWPADDVYISAVLDRHGHKPLKGFRTTYNHDEKIYEPCYHIRCKDDKLRRELDVEAMHHIFKTIR